MCNFVSPIDEAERMSRDERIGMEYKNQYQMKIKPLYPLLLLLLIVAFFHTALAQSRVIPGNRSTTWTQAEWLKHNLQYYKLVSLDMLDSLYEVKRYTLKTQELYGVDE